MTGVGAWGNSWHMNYGPDISVATPPSPLTPLSTNRLLPLCLCVCVLVSMHVACVYLFNRHFVCPKSKPLFTLFSGKCIYNFWYISWPVAGEHLLIGCTVACIFFLFNEMQISMQLRLLHSCTFASILETTWQSACMI